MAALAFAAGTALQLGGGLAMLERETLQARFDMRGAERPNDIVVVAIDARSFGVLGRQWPFPRSLHGEAVRRLDDAGAREIVYDVQFTEPTRPREDLALYDAIDRAGGAVLATSESDGRGGTNVLGGDANLARVNARAAASDLMDDRGGEITHFPHEVGGLESLAVVGAERAGGPALAASAFAGGGAWIDYRGPPGTIATVSFADLIEGDFAPGTFRDRVVVVGAGAPTLRDVHPTPMGSDELMVGAEVQANAIWTALHGLPLRDAGTLAALALIAVCALAVPLMGLRFPVLAVAAGLPLAAALLALGAQLAFHAGVVIKVVPPLLALAIGGAGTLVWSQIGERRARRLLARDNDQLEAAVRERTRELHDTQLEIALRLGRAVESRDGETGEHIDRIGIFCERLALAIGISPPEAELLHHASALHDVGKVAIPDRILLKPGSLDAEEWETMKTHTTLGAAMLADSGSRLIRLAETIAASHHERWDGGGYPLGLAGEQIPLAGRICAICDVFDALLSPRPYKQPWPLDETLAELERQRGSHFDPELVDVFLPLAPDLHRRWFSARAGEHAVAA